MRLEPMEPRQRHDPPSLRGAANDPSLRNQLQPRVLPVGRRQTVQLGTENPTQLLGSSAAASRSADTPQRKPAAAVAASAAPAAADEYLFTI